MRPTPTRKRSSPPPDASGDLAARLREVAEYPNAFIELGPGQERIETVRFTLCLEPSLRGATVQRQRLDANEAGAAIEEARVLLRARGRDRTQWEVGSATPAGLVDALLARGLQRDDEPFAIALALTRRPPPAPDGLTAVRVDARDAATYAAGHRVQDLAFGGSGEIDTDAAIREWRSTSRIMHVVRDGSGDVVAAGTCTPASVALAMFGGAVHPAARGRGAYRALVAARWQEAAARGLPALVTQAGAMSEPVLARLGFDAVGRVEMLVDRF